MGLVSLIISIAAFVIMCLNLISVLRSEARPKDIRKIKKDIKKSGRRRRTFRIYALFDWDGNCFGMFTKKAHAEIVKAEYKRMGLELHHEDFFVYSNKKELKDKLEHMMEEEKRWRDRWKGGEE